jgi:hypothetical protein
LKIIKNKKKKQHTTSQSIAHTRALKLTTQQSNIQNQLEPNFRFRGDQPIIHASS